MTRQKIDTYLESLRFNRSKTLASLDSIQQFPEALAILGWRPGKGRASIAWQLMHIGITEELFSTARLFGTHPSFPELIDRFRGGSTPDDNVPEIGDIRTVLDQSRQHWLQALDRFTDADLGWIPDPIKDRGWTLQTILNVLSWHEAHHQGQIHITLNLWKCKSE
jgi:uncharacterized damage-inducible protein DinB